MTVSPLWLPPVTVLPVGWAQVCAQLYAIFYADFIEAHCLYGGLPIWWDRRIVTGQTYEEGFLHLITRLDQRQGKRVLDPLRAERLPWCAPTIRNAADSAVTVWDYWEGKGQRRTYLWLHAWDYVVILQKTRKGNAYLLVTAYHVDGESTRRSLRRKLAQRIT